MASYPKGRAKMNSRFLKGMIAAAIALPGLSGAALGGSDDLGCSNATLKGAYAFSVLTVAAPQGVPNVVVGLTTFDGRGGLTQMDYPGDSGLSAFRTGQTGTYIVNSDCTGFSTVNLGGGAVVETAFVISNGGRSTHGVVAEFTLEGTAAPIQSRVDGWKVASEQDTEYR
jgi:hypothetical protein